MNELMFRPVHDLADLVRQGEVSSTELVDASLERIDALNTEINAFVLVDEDGARATAAEIGAGDPRPFAGVPIAIKDGNAVKGLRLTVGSELFGDFVAPHDTFVVRRIRQAGFVIVGKTNLPEFGILPTTEPRRFGPTRNPWDTERTPGGSSGGAAAAVASGMVPIAQGSDGGGSIRIPAACCGLVGLKTARMRISRGPEFGDDFLVQDGVLTRTSRETAELLDLLAGYEPGDANWPPPPAEPFAEAARKEPGSLRIALTTTPPIDTEIDPQAERGARQAAELLSSLGHEVREITPPWTGDDVLPAFTKVFCTHIATGIYFGGQVTDREPSPDLIEPLSMEIWRGVNEYSGLDYTLAKLRLEALTRQVVAMWADCDVLLTPALGERPVPLGEIDSCSDDPWEDFRRSGRFTPFTAIFNVTGQPAISVPLFQGDDGLPLGVQLVGPPAGEGLLLSLASQLEAARPWADRRPELARA
jgi:amidase